MTLASDYIFPVQAPTGGAALRTTIEDALKLATAPNLAAVTETGATTQIAIELQDSNVAPSITLDAPTGNGTFTGKLDVTGNITVSSGDTQILLNAATGEITAKDIITTGPIQAEDIQAGTGDNAILLDGSTGQVGSDDDTNFMDGGVYSTAGG